MKNYWKSKKVLITGGRGFIGSSVLKELVKRKSIVTITVTSVRDVEKSIPKEVTFKKADLTDLSQCMQVTKNIDIILNFAALDGGQSYKREHSAEIFMANTRIVSNILEASKENKVDRILLMSSTDVYADLDKSIIKEEDGFKDDFNNLKYGYAWSKRFSEVAAKTYYDQYGLKIAIARAGNIYGLNDTKGIIRGRVIPTFIDKAIKNESLEVIGGNKRKSFLFIDDLVSALLNLVEKYPVCEPINIVSSRFISIEDLAKLIIRSTNSKSKLIVTKAKPERKRIISNNKAKNTINFQENATLEQKIKIIINSRQYVDSN